MHPHPSVWISCTVVMLSRFAVNAKTSPWPNDPKTISSKWIALQTSVMLLYHVIYLKGPLNQELRVLEHFQTVFDMHLAAI